MKLCMMLPPRSDKRWILARQMGVDHAIAKLAPELTGTLPPWDEEALAGWIDAYRRGGFEIVGLEGDQFDMARIKLGLPGRDDNIELYKRMLQNLGRSGIRLLCYNFMVGIGWYRTRTAVPTRGGALVTGFRLSEAEALGTTDAGVVSADRIWENYSYFITRVLPAAEDAGVRMALHPDDPPVSTLRGIGRIFSSIQGLERAYDLAPSPMNAITFCQGSYRTMGEDVPSLVTRFGPERIAFIHVRDIRGTAEDFTETFPDDGSTDMAAVFRAYAHAGLDIPMRPDHAPAIEGDRAHHGEVSGINVGYEAYGMVHTLGYMKGLLAATS